MRLRSLPILLIAATLLSLSGPAHSQEGGGHIEIIEIGGNLEDMALDFLAERIDAAAQAKAMAVVIQLDSRATLSADLYQLAARMADPPLPLVVWVGPAPASALGGAAHLLMSAPIRAAAPGATIGYTEPAVVGDDGALSGGTNPLLDLSDTQVQVGEPIEGLVDLVAPSIHNLLVELDGRTVSVRGVPTTLHTVESTDDGSLTAVQTVFYQPSLGVSVLRASTGAEAAFFLLMVGLAVVAFEFYSLGPGIAAGVGALMLLIGSYGLIVLPLRGWAVGLALMGLWLLTVDFQRGTTGPLTALGASAMFAGGLYFTDAAPQIRPSWWIVLVIVVSVTAFYVVGIRTVARARFSTPTIGRDFLKGRLGQAVSVFNPDGVVELEGARWGATAHREAKLVPGDEVMVLAVDGAILEVEPRNSPD